MADPKELSGKRFDHLLYKYLDKHDGVFLGETHGDPAMVQSITKLMPALHARQVATISMEVPQKIIKSMRSAASTEDWVKEHKNFNGGEATARAYCDLVKTADKFHIQVLGHECKLEAHEKRLKVLEQELAKKSPKLHKMVQSIFMLSQEGKNIPEDLKNSILKELGEIDVDKKRKEEKELYLKYDKECSYGLSEEGVNERNKAANEYIRKNKRKGKTIVVGGSFHSGDYSRKDYWKATGGEGENLAMRVTKPYKGLDKLLNYPSIDYFAGGYFSGFPSGEIGQTFNRYNGMFNNAEVVLPKDLKDLKTNQWPPLKDGIPTTPTIEEVNLAFPVKPNIPPSPASNPPRSPGRK